MSLKWAVSTQNDIISNHAQKLDIGKKKKQLKNSASGFIGITII